MKREVVIAGGNGRIGGIIFQSLKDVFGFISLDLHWPNMSGQVITFVDVANNYEGLKTVMKGRCEVIHLAWDSKENWKSGIVEPNNKKMAENVYKAALEAGVKRVIMASSIHADDFCRPDRPCMMTPNLVPVPDSPYGATKVYIESLGRYYATKHELEVVCIRFGGVDSQDVIRPEQDYKKIVLSRRDCANLIRCCLEAKAIPGKFCLLYGISNNTNRIHDWQNPLGWVPQDDGAKM